MPTQSHGLFDGLNIIATEEVGTKTYEVCAKCEATFDENTSKLSVGLQAFVRQFEIQGKDEVSHPPWLPRAENVKMGVSHEEACDAAKEIFSSWVKRVRLSIPPTSEWLRHQEWFLAEKEKDKDQ